jgi:hypothetical protein
VVGDRKRSELAETIRSTVAKADGLVMAAAGLASAILLMALAVLVLAMRVRAPRSFP